MMRVFFVCGVLLAATAWGDPVDRAEEALRYYRQGEVATELEEREVAFNEALVIYAELAQTYPTGRVFYNLGNCYFQLGEYAWAVLYYQRALQDLPRDQRILQNLSVAQEKLGIESDNTPSVIERVLFFHYRLSQGERWTLFSVCAVLALCATSLLLWQRRRHWLLAGMGSALFAATMLLSIVISHFFGGVYGVAIRAAPLYRDAGTRYALVREAPLPAGVRVEVVDVVEEGQWLRVTGDGTMGFVQADDVRSI